MTGFIRKVATAAGALGMLGALAAGVAPAGATAAEGHSVAGQYIGFVSGDASPVFLLILASDHDALFSLDGAPIISGTWGYSQATDHVYAVVSGTPLGTCHLSGLKVPAGISTPHDPGTLTCSNGSSGYHTKWYALDT